MKNQTRKIPKIESLCELGVVLGIGEEILKKMQKSFPDMKIGESYKGKFTPYIIEYVNTFIAKDIIENDLDEATKTDLWQEVAFIECFCKWLDEEKKIDPNKR